MLAVNSMHAEDGLLASRGMLAADGGTLAFSSILFRAALCDARLSACNQRPQIHLDARMKTAGCARTQRNRSVAVRQRKQLVLHCLWPCSERCSVMGHFSDLYNPKIPKHRKYPN